MRHVVFCLYLLIISSLTGYLSAQTIVTEKPRYEEANDPEVSIRRVELTPAATVIYMTFAKRRNASADMVPVSEIQFQPTARLYVNQGEFSYKFVRATNIPVQTKREVTSGQRVDFVVYFERLRPGQTSFDLYECSDRDGYVCFNFWNVHVNNPGPRSKPTVPVTPKPTTPTTPVVPVKPVPRPAPAPPVSTSTAPVTPPVVAAGVAIRGTVQDAVSHKLLRANVSSISMAGSGRTVNLTESERETGTFRIEAKPQTVYALTVSAKGYFNFHDTVRVGAADLVQVVNLSPIVVGAKITLRNLYFDASAFVVRPESLPELDRLARIMADNPTLTVRLEGHTDIVGDYDQNIELSRNRVGAVRDYLVKKGIATGRITVVGYGASRPINKNRTLAERPENRRVELVVTGI